MITSCKSFSSRLKPGCGGILLIKNQDSVLTLAYESCSFITVDLVLILLGEVSMFLFMASYENRISEEVKAPSGSRKINCCPKIKRRRFSEDSIC